MTLPEGISERRRQLYSLLGELPDRNAPISVVTLTPIAYKGYRVERLVISCNGREPVPAYFATPSINSADRFPVILYNHASGDDMELGKDELLRGRGALQSPAYGEALLDAGYAVLCIDMWGFGERRGRSLNSLFKEMLWKGEVLWGRMVYDSLRMVDYLHSRPEVDSTRIGTLGLSSGSTMAWWSTALDDRIKVCVDLCCLTDFEALIEYDGLDGHGAYYYVPKLLKYFGTSEINALIAPRPHLSLAGNYDPLTPRAGLDRIDRSMRQEYASHGAGEAWRLSRHECGHFETALMRTEAMAFLHHWL